MKLHRITMENLSSLQGVQTIDFDRDLTGAPLFLIMGPTGAGKSTILDAICLALFGETPRLRKMRGREDTNPAQIMSWGTGKCRAELIFSKVDEQGVRKFWRAVWSCRRSREKASGALQSPERSIVELAGGPDGEPIEGTGIATARVTEAEAVFAEVLEHMTVEDFKRSILLAQGDFDAFLHAESHEKASILERLTNTDHYKRIGRRAHERYKQIQGEYELLVAQINEGLPLTLEREGEQRARLEEVRAARVALAGELEQLRAWLAWHQESARLEQALHGAAAARASLEGEVERFAPDHARLIVDRKARPAQPVIEQIEALEAQIVDLDHRAEALERELIKDREVEAERRERVSAGAQRVGAADSALTSALPTLRSAQELSAAIARDATSAAALGEAAQQAEAMHATHRAELEAAQQTLVGAQDRQRAAQLAREEIPHGEGLLDAYAALSEALRNLEARDAERGEAAGLVAQIEAERAQIEADRARCDAELGEQRAARAKLEGEQRAALAALGEVLAGAPDAASRKKALLAEHDEVQGALRVLEEARRDHDRLTALHAKLVELEQSSSQQGLLHAQLSARRDEQQRDLEQTLALQKEREERRRATELALVMVRHKHELRDGAPCPLCGSEEHPGSAGGADDIAAQRIKLEAQLSAVETSLARDVAHIAQVRESLRDLDAELAEADSRLRAQRERRDERASEQREALGRYNGGRASQGLDPVQRFPQDNAAQQALLGQLQQKIGEQQRELEAHAADLAMLDQQRDALHEVQQQIARLRDQEAARELERLEERARNAGARVEEARQRSGQLVEAVTSGCDALGSRLAMLELIATDARGIEALREGVELGSRRRASFVAASAGLSEASAQALALGKEVAVLEERTRDAASRLELATSQRDAASQRLAADRERLVGMVGEVDPKAREQELRDALSAAQREQSEAQEAHHAAAQRVATQETLAREVAARLAQAQQRLIAEQEALTNLLHRLGMADAAAVRAVLLSPEERASLEARDATLQAERAVRDRVLGEAQAAQAAHTSGRPMAEVEGAADATSAQEALARLDARREVLAQEVGALEHELEEQDRARAKVSSFEAQLDELTRQRDVWKRISDLIGRKDGDRFKEFAQSLNLQSLLQRANARLRRFTPRYTLGTAREEDDYKMQWPTMSFVVIDSYQAHSERPVTTLSGGETFMVSLSLALALADMRRQAMPQETLLMDEGFGTLDQHTLSIVMNTLQLLHQDANQQIGLISHVEALRERIPYRVVVEPMGTGRSLIRMEQPDRHLAFTPRPELSDDFPY